MSVPLINITTFKSLPTEGKVPLSPYDDKTFDFITTTYKLNNTHNVFEQNFLLSTPISSACRLTKTKSNLIPIQETNNSNYIVLDFDNMTSPEDADNVIEFFQNNNYTINIFKSKSYNTLKKGEMSFNIKAVLMFDKCYIDESCGLKPKECREAIINYLNDVLGSYCEVDSAAAVENSHQAPTYNPGCLYYNEGKDFYIPNLKDYVMVKPSPMSINFEQDITGWFYNHLITQYGAVFKSGSNNDVFSVHLPIEMKSKFGYFWSRQSPYILQHPQKSKNINMFSDFIKSPDGKEYIKKQHVRTFVDAFEALPGYHFDSRYFTINPIIESKVEYFIKYNDILVVKGIMGSGKSEVIHQLLNIQKSRVLLLTMRRSLAMDMATKYRIKNYIDDLNNNTKTQYKVGDSLVIQIDSLHKINPNDFDYVVIDEFESLCLYVDNNLKNSSHYVKNMKYLRELFAKKLLLADAFMNSLTLKLHFNNRKMEYITNDYKDVCNVFIYKHKQTFVNFLEQLTIDKKSDEFITCSFGTLNELKSVERILQEHGLRVISITSETTDDAKKVIYKIFEEKHHNKYDVVLFSPTITVGVSILNNVKHHFHFDSGKSIDPISSIQMLKRSRTVENIHIFIKGNQTYFKSYSVNYLNEQVTSNIKDYLNDMRNIIFYNVDNDTLSELGVFVNTFVAHNNFFSNGHENTFKFLLTQQFKNIREINEDIPHIKFEQYRKEISKDNKISTLFDNISSMSNMNVTHDISELNYLQTKKRTNDEEREMLFLEVKEMFPKLNEDVIFNITKTYTKDKQYINKLNAFIIFNTKRNMIDNIITSYALSNISKIFSKHNEDDYIKLLKYMLKLPDIKLQEFYSKNELKTLDVTYSKYGNSFSWFLSRIGFNKINGGLKVSTEFKNHINSILKICM